MVSFDGVICGTVLVFSKYYVLQQCSGIQCSCWFFRSWMQRGFAAWFYLGHFYSAVCMLVFFIYQYVVYLGCKFHLFFWVTTHFLVCVIEKQKEVPVRKCTFSKGLPFMTLVSSVVVIRHTISLEPCISPDFLELTSSDLSRGSFHPIGLRETLYTIMTYYW